MPEIKVYYPQDDATLRTNFVLAVGKYQLPERIRGVLNSTESNASYVGDLRVLPNDLWVLVFGEVQHQVDYVMHIFDMVRTSVQININLSVRAAASGRKTEITFPISGVPLLDRNVAIVGTTRTQSIEDVRITHAGQADLVAPSLPITPISRVWSTTITIPTDYPCPGDSPDYCIHVEDFLGIPHCDLNDVQLDADTFCPQQPMRRRSSMDGKASAKKKKKTMKKKKKPARKK